MHYVVGDVHNDAKRLNRMLERIGFLRDGTDSLILLGDLFDRGGTAADPVGVYFTVLGLGDACSIVRGNHDQWLASYIRSYYSLPRRDRKEHRPYLYESFGLLCKRLTDVDIQNLAEWILRLPIQAQLKIGGRRYLFAHALTSLPQIERSDDYYLMAGLFTGDGEESFDNFLLRGIPGYTSFCGHQHTSYFTPYPGVYCDEERPSIWHNDAGNVYMMDCGCGFASGKLACYCLETGERFYV